MIEFIDLKKINKYIKRLCPKGFKCFLSKIRPQKINILQIKELFFKKSGFINKINEIETLVLGSSNGAYGFNPIFFNKNSYNLCYLTIIIPPARTDYKKNLPDSDYLLKELYNISKNQFNVFNFYDDTDFAFDDFGDFDHLNYNGAKKLIQKIGEYLK